MTPFITAAQADEKIQSAFNVSSNSIEAASQGIIPFETLQEANSYFAANPPATDRIFRVYTGSDAERGDRTRYAATNTNSPQRPIYGTQG